MCVAGLSMSVGHGNGHFSLGEGWGGGVRPPLGDGRVACCCCVVGVVLFGSGGPECFVGLFLSLPSLAYKILCLTPLYMGAFYVSLYVCWCVCIDVSICVCLWVGIYFLIICLFLSWEFRGIGFVTLEAFFPTSLPCTATTFGGTLDLFPYSFFWGSSVVGRSCG